MHFKCALPFRSVPREYTLHTFVSQNALHFAAVSFFVIKTELYWQILLVTQQPHLMTQISLHINIFTSGFLIHLSPIVIYGIGWLNKEVHVWTYESEVPYKSMRQRELRLPVPFTSLPHPNTDVHNYKICLGLASGNWDGGCGCILSMLVPLKNASENIGLAFWRLQTLNRDTDLEATAQRCV